MKLRKGFVSNSSSSSFICDVCGDCSEVYEGESEEGPVNQCKEGHSWHDECFPINGSRYEVSEKDCPICSMKKISPTDFTKYLVNKTGKTVEQIEEDIKNEFKNYDLFCVYLKRGNE